jgi:hypothetical protein
LGGRNKYFVAGITVLKLYLSEILVLSMRESTDDTSNITIIESEILFPSSDDYDVHRFRRYVDSSTSPAVHLPFAVFHTPSFTSQRGTSCISRAPVQIILG